MAAQQSPQPDPPRAAPAPRAALGRALLWPAAALGLGVLLISNSFESPVGFKAEPRPVAVAPATPEATAPRAGLALPRSLPKRLSIPKIAVDAPFTSLSISASGQLNTPPVNNKNLVGWFRGGAAPGERGSSIVVGHVDTKTGPAVFARLSTLKPGSTVNITRADGIVATFKVDSVDTFSKANFPDDRVYADTPSPQLRLITCGGEYDRKAKNYKDNVVVFAHLDSSRTA